MLWKGNLDHNTNDSTNAMYICKEILRRIYGPIQDNERWHLRWNSEICNSYQNLNTVADIQCVGCVMRMEAERISKRGS